MWETGGTSPSLPSSFGPLTSHGGFPQTADNVLITDPDMVAGDFRSFFASLYSSAANNPREEIEALLAGIELPTLSQSQIEMLEAPITVSPRGHTNFW